MSSELHRIRLSAPVLAVRAGRREVLLSGAPVDVESERARAYRRGLREGQEVAQRQLAPLLASLGERLREQSEEASAALRAVEARLVELALVVAERIVAREVAAGRHDVQALVARVLEQAQEATQAILFAHPDDLARLEECAPPDLRLEADPSLRPGEIVLESPTGRIVATIEAQLANVRHALLSSEVLP
ncbi:MAG: hypothetical protein D6731_20370 [Planctomycetota bacterium]|nr:MAG: hypothetical protein D6731_20370 [Planctomycetota bacterium]